MKLSFQESGHWEQPGESLSAFTSDPLILVGRRSKALLTWLSQHRSVLYSAQPTFLRRVIFCLLSIPQWIQHNAFDADVSRVHTVSFYCFRRPSVYISFPSLIHVNSLSCFLFFQAWGISRNEEDRTVRKSWWGESERWGEQSRRGCWNLKDLSHWGEE